MVRKLQHGLRNTRHISATLCGPSGYMYSLSRTLISKPSNFVNTLSDQWMERILDDSTIRRIDIPEMFLLADAALIGLDKISSGLNVYPKRVEFRVQEELPFRASLQTAAGETRQEAHEQVRALSHQASSVVKNEDKPNDLISRMTATEFFKPIRGEIDEMLRAELYTGRSVEIVERFCGENGVLTKKVKPYRSFIENSAWGS